MSEVLNFLIKVKQVGPAQAVLWQSRVQTTAVVKDGPIRIIGRKAGGQYVFDGLYFYDDRIEVMYLTEDSVQLEELIESLTPEDETQSLINQLASKVTESSSPRKEAALRKLKSLGQELS